jgi:hypothetical protein
LPVLIVAEQPHLDEGSYASTLELNLPPGAVPDITYYELHAAFTR